MSFDIVLMAIVVGGIGLSAAYVRAEYMRWRGQGAMERRREKALRELHAARLSEQQQDAPLPSVLRLQGFGRDEAANPESAAVQSSAPRSNAPRIYPFEERRKRPRQRANQ
jgi:hypothetical protein